MAALYDAVFADQLASLRDAVELRSAAGTLDPVLRALDPPRNPSPEVWREAVNLLGLALPGALDQGLEWLVERQVKRLLTDCFPIHPSRWIDDLAERLQPVLTYLEEATARQRVEFCWDVLTGGQYCPSVKLSKWMRAQHLKGGLERGYDLEAFRLAIGLCKEGDLASDWGERRWRCWSWERDTRQYLALMGDDSPLVRAAAAYALGRFYLGCAEKSGRDAVPRFGEMLEFLKREEETRPGAAGPFLNGADFGMSEVETWDPAVDFWEWAFEVIAFNRNEPNLPHQKPLWYFVIDAFDADPNGVDRMIRIGREDLAVMAATATGERVEGMEPMLRRLAQSKDSNVAARAGEHLNEFYSAPNRASA